jgi:phosphocarrier protein HPr
MIEGSVEIVNELGLHARAASKFVNAASRFHSEIKLHRADNQSEEVDGKSILGILLLAASRGTQLTIRATGLDEREAMEALLLLVRGGFGEIAR